MGFLEGQVSMTTETSRSDNDTATTEHAPTLDDAAIHTLGHCMWWVNQGDQLPADPAHRDLIWRDECYAWVAEARQLLLHLEYNGLTVRRK
jgi:hypothetical protein